MFHSSPVFVPSIGLLLYQSYNWVTLFWLAYSCIHCWATKHVWFQALSGVGESIQDKADILQNTALSAALNTQFLFQIGVFTAVPMILGFILEQGFLKVASSWYCLSMLCIKFCWMRCFRGLSVYHHLHHHHQQQQHLHHQTLVYPIYLGFWLYEFKFSINPSLG